MIGWPGPQPETVALTPKSVALRSEPSPCGVKVSLWPRECVALPAPEVISQPAGFSFGHEQLGAGYENARAQLDKRFQERLAALPAADRTKVERNLADLRRAADEISATLAKNPSDPLLQDLLMSTYQSELQMLANVSELPTAGSMRTDL